MLKFRKIIIILFLMFLAQLFPKGVFAESKDYYISNIVINVAVKENGNMDVSEGYDYVFDGNFNGIKREVNTDGSDGIKDISVEVRKNGVDEKNNPEISEDGNKTEIKINSKSENETKNFKINYTIKNAVTKFSDLGELKWVFYKNEANVKINKITVYVSLPKDMTNQVKYYGEGPKRGKTSLDGNNIKLELNNMEKDEVIGVSALFPSDWVNTSRTINMKRDAYYKKQEHEKNRNIMIVSLIVVITASLAAGFIYLKRRKRQKAIRAYREGHVFFNDKYYSEIPSDLPPALVSMLVDGDIDTKDFLATIIYLSNKGAIEFLKSGFEEEDFKKISFRINDNYDKNDLMEYEIFLINWIRKYSKNKDVSLEELKKKSGETKFITKYVEWKKLILKQTEKMNFYITIEGKKILTNTYENERFKWEAFGDYLNDFKNIKVDGKKEKLNEKVLPYAISLEVSENFIENFQKSSDYSDNMLMSYWFLSYYTTTYNDDFNMDSSGGNSDSIGGDFSGGSGGGFGGGGGSSAF